MMRRWYMLCLLGLLLMSLPSVAQETDEGLALRVQTIDGVHLLVPANWDRIEAGAFVAPDDNLSYFLYVTHPEPDDDAVLAALFGADVSARPRYSGQVRGATYTWRLYTLTYRVPDAPAQIAVVDVAIADDGAQAYALILQTSPDRYRRYQGALFTPILQTFDQSPGDLLAYLGLERVVLADLNLQTAIPSGWATVNVGAYMRQQTPDDPTTLLVQATTEGGALGFARALLTQLQLPPDLPDDVQIDRYHALEWSLYRIDVAAPDMPLVLHLAMAQDADQAYLVALLVRADSADALYDTVFLPTVAATGPSDG